MKNTQKTLLTAFVASFLFILSLSPAYAHFHYEAAVTTVFKMDKSDQLEALDISWVYDPEASEIMLKDNQDIKALGVSVITDLAKLGYFTKITFNDKPLETGMVKDFKLEKIGTGKDTQLKLNFTLPLKSSVSLKGKNFFALDHTDPTGSAILYYDGDKHIVLDKSIDEHCITMIKEKPDFQHGQSPQNISLFCEVPDSQAQASK